MNCITEPSPTATVTLEELPRLDRVESVDFTGATYVYDGDGEAILRIACEEFWQSENSRLNCASSSYVDGLTTFYVGGYYEYVQVVDGDDTITTETKYYTGATGRFAMRIDTTTETAFSSMTTNELYWIFSDHLQSSSEILEEDGALLRKEPF